MRLFYNELPGDYLYTRKTIWSNCVLDNTWGVGIMENAKVRVQKSKFVELKINSTYIYGKQGD
jgi:glycine cleavage system H lipoate-binding protein